MDRPESSPPSLLSVVLHAIERRRPEWEAEAQEAVAQALAEHGRDPTLAPLIVGPAKPDPPGHR
jgi:hypothetical protein